MSKSLDYHRGVRDGVLGVPNAPFDNAKNYDYLAGYAVGKDRRMALHIDGSLGRMTTTDGMITGAASRVVRGSITKF